MTVLCDIYDVITTPKGYANMSPAYFDSMMHAVPKAEVIKNRELFILQRCKGKRVINFGSESGLLNADLKRVARSVCGVDKIGNPDFRIDLDDFDDFDLPFSDVLVCGEVLEHLSNPGRFLQKVKSIMANTSELIITVPNAFNAAAPIHTKRGYENVNKDHTCWYSWRTLKTLVERAGFEVKEFYWYGPGEPGFTEGLIFVVN